MINDTTQILVVDHSQSEAALVDVSVETTGNTHQDNFNHLLELISWHLYFVQQTLRSKDFIVDYREASSRMLRLVKLSEIRLSSAPFLTNLPQIALHHELIQIVVVAYFVYNLKYFRHVTRLKCSIEDVMSCCCLVTWIILESIDHFKVDIFVRSGEQFVIFLGMLMHTLNELGITHIIFDLLQVISNLVRLDLLWLMRSSGYIGVC